MKTKNLITSLILMISAFHFSYSQEGNCKVLKPEISTSYSGDCKKGLASGKGIAAGIDKYEGKFKEGLPHGAGIYRYANGDIYEGDFKEGKKNGNGKFTFKFLGKDSTYTGIWKEDQLVRQVVPPPYIIDQTSNIQRYSVRKTSAGNRVMFSFIQNGKTNLSITGLSFAGTAGSPLTIGQETGFDNIQFPFHCKVSYTSSNSFQSTTFAVIFEIQINEPGQWQVTLYN